jgi:hypothetical protein
LDAMTHFGLRRAEGYDPVRDYTSGRGKGKGKGKGKGVKRRADGTQSRGG